MDNAQNLGLGQSQDPFEVAATMFGLYSFQLERGTKALDTKQLRTLILALLTSPLNEKDISMEESVSVAYKEIKNLMSNRQLNVETFESKVAELSTGELRRLVNAIVQFPLADKDYIDSHSGQNLKDAFAIGARLSEARTLMFVKTLSDYETSLMEKQNQTSVPEVVSNNNVQEPNGDVTNG